METEKEIIIPQNQIALMTNTVISAIVFLLLCLFFDGLQTSIYIHISMLLLTSFTGAASTLKALKINIATNALGEAGKLKEETIWARYIRFARFFSMSAFFFLCLGKFWTGLANSSVDIATSKITLTVWSGFFSLYAAEFIEFSISLRAYIRQMKKIILERNKVKEVSSSN